MRLTPPSGQLDLDPAVAAQRQLVLGDLIALRQVRVMVVLTRKDRRLRDLTVERQPRADRGFDRGPVAHRQRARQPQTDRAGVRIGRRALIVRAAAAEHLRLRQQLRVDFHAHDDVVFLFQLRRPLCEIRVLHISHLYVSAGSCQSCFVRPVFLFFESFFLWHLCWLLSVEIVFTWRWYYQHRHYKSSREASRSRTSNAVSPSSTGLMNSIVSPRVLMRDLSLPKKGMS